MGQLNAEGYFDVAFNADRTQVLANLHPPRGAGQSVRLQNVLEKLERMGVVHGIRESEIAAAIERVIDTAQPAMQVVVAQGILPEDGRDAQILWKMDPAFVTQPLPRLAPEFGRAPDYLSYDPARRVAAGQMLAVISPSTPGRPGQTVTVPFKVVPQMPGSGPSVVAGPGVHVSVGGLQYIAAVNGFPEVRGGEVRVHALDWIAKDLDPGQHDLAAGIIVLGDIRASNVRAHGPVAVRGDVVGAAVRADGDIHVTNATHAKLLADGSVYVRGTLTDCEVIASGKVVALGAGAMVGGTIVATDGVEAHDLGAASIVGMRVVVGVDRLAKTRRDEVQEEIRECESNIQHIGQALGPLTALSASPMQEQKRQLVHTLLDRRRDTEQRLRDLRQLERTLAVAGNRKSGGTVRVAGRVYPGVSITIRDVTAAVYAMQSHVVFYETSGQPSVGVRPVAASVAA